MLTAQEEGVQAVARGWTENGRGSGSDAAGAPGATADKLPYQEALTR